MYIKKNPFPVNNFEYEDNPKDVESNSNNIEINEQNNNRSRRFYFDQTTFKTHHRIQIILLPFNIPTHNQNHQTPITCRNRRWKILFPHTSPDAAVEQRTIQKMLRPPDVTLCPYMYNIHDFILY